MFKYFAILFCLCLSTVLRAGAAQVTCEGLFSQYPINTDIRKWPSQLRSNPIVQRNAGFFSRFAHEVFRYGFVLNLFRASEPDHRTVRMATYKKSDLHRQPSDEWVQIDYSSRDRNEMLVTYYRKFYFGKSFAQEAIDAQVIPLRALFDLLTKLDSDRIPEFAISTSGFGYQIVFEGKSDEQMFTIIDQLRTVLVRTDAVPPRYLRPLEVSQEQLSVLFGIFGAYVTTERVNGRLISLNEVVAGLE